MKRRFCVKGYFVVAVVWGWLLMVGASPAEEIHGPGVALVIGNGRYTEKPLQNAVNDARAMRDVLGKQLGFEVIYRENADQAQMDDALSDFKKRLNPNTVGLFYYAGHAMQENHNYLIPIGAKIDYKTDLFNRTLDVQAVLETMEYAKNRLNIVILDACRDSPFRSFRGSGDGLAATTGPKGSWIAFATAPGNTADDGSDDNGVYTKHILRWITQPGLKIEELFKQVRVGVAQETQGEQVPWDNSSLMGEYCFAGCLAQNPPQPTVLAPVSVPLPPAQIPAPAAQFEPMPAPTASPCAYCPEMVRLPTGIAMGKYEVTQGQWRAVMGDSPSWFSKCGDDCPVENVSWDDVQVFIQRLNAKTGQHYRLPTEAEWFSACQAGRPTEYCGSDDVDGVAWYLDNSSSKTHPAGKKQPNAWGLYDMSGNVWEWTQDCWEGDCGRRVIRGGSWFGTPAYVRAAFRYWDFPNYRSLSFGFRLAQD